MSLTSTVTTYSPCSVPSFCVGNPLSEALPALPLDAHLATALAKEPRGDFSSRTTNARTAFFEVSSALDINYPRPESRIVAMRTFSMLHNTYSKMNPLSPEFISSVNDIDEKTFQLNEKRPFQCDAMTLLAWSGMGKTTLFNSIASLLPRVIEHSSYKGKPFFMKQVVWLSVDAPVGGSPKGFLLNIAEALDRALDLHGAGSNYYDMLGKSAETMKVHIARALRIHCVGLLHVDDVQRWGESDATAKRTSVAMLVGLANTIGCALLLSGTQAAVGVLQSNFEATRRANRRPAVLLTAPKDEEDPFFKGLVDFLFRFQLTAAPVVATAEIRRTLLELTAGIPGVLTSLYVSAQETALLTSRPLSKELFQASMASDFSLLVRPLKKLRALRIKGEHQWNADIDRAISEALKK